MNSLSAERPAVKPSRAPRKPKVKVRTVRLVQAPSPGRPGTLDIVEDGKPTCFWVRPIPHDFGQAAFLLEKYETQCRGEDDKAYNVLLAGQQSSCECLGHMRWGHCRHVEALQKLLDLGKLQPAEGYKPDVAF